MRRLGLTVLAWTGLVAIAGSAGAALGWLSWRFWVVGLGGLALGLVVGWGLAFFYAWIGAPRRAALAAAVAILCGWTVLQLFDDASHRRAERLALAEKRAANETHLAPEELQTMLVGNGLEFFGAGSDDTLDKRVESTIGFGGVAGRWVFRAQDGVRLAGSWRQGWRLPVGLAGVIVETLLELALAVLIATRIARRARAPARG